MNARTPGDHGEEPESLAQLRRDCARITAHRGRHPEPGPAAAGGSGSAAGPALPRGVRVPERSAHLLDGMSDYGD